MPIEKNHIFKIDSAAEFENIALKIFKYQYQNNTIYNEFCNHLNRTDVSVKSVNEIPFLPISFFKSKQIISSSVTPEITFTSSGTTGTETSKHFVHDLNLYEQSYLTAFEHFYGPISDYCILALLPAYLERKGSSLIYMVDDLIKKSNHSDSGFYLNNLEKLHDKLLQLKASGTKTLLIGVSFALLDMVEKFEFQLNNTIIMETGGMKGRRKELIRDELHHILKTGFGVKNIHSEYGMTELLSQAYSSGEGIFKTPPWMKVLIRDTEDPLSFMETQKSGGVNIIDLANRDSCSFIATQDLGKVYSDGSFEILGRFDHSDVRGCNLMVL
ncbi:acyl transferase [Aurantibacter crassamenti]|uniref:LuxE/PaaK family acyltransferase n=1 Tax=Aurantibacter crassamenti TaxID=1837375 RepID=UPI001939685F|nr:acyl transferase [Aurantibacter crassamenti]MBM1104788.1 acyl transferase [Aurantibacter crassamenti]